MNKNVLITGGSKGIGLELVKYFNAKNINTVSISRTKSKYTSDLNHEILFDLIDFENFDNIQSILTEHRIKNAITDIIFNLGDGKKFSDDKEIENNYYEMINFISSKKLSEYFLENYKGINTFTFINSICRFNSANCNEGYTKSKQKLFKYSKEIEVDAASKHIRVNSLTLGDVLHKNSSWSKKFKNKEEEDSYLKKTKLNNKFVNTKDICLTINLIIENNSLIGEEIILDCGHTKLLPDSPASVDD
tara:strand:- start:6188 stop:6928 length:741 start_codon:yes stop_codon:yes gene_type:complete